MQRHFLTTYCQVSHLCRQYTNPSYIITSNKRRGIGTAIPTSTKLLQLKLREIMKSDDDDSTRTSKAPSSGQNQEAGTTKISVSRSLLPRMTSGISERRGQKQSDYESTSKYNPSDLIEVESILEVAKSDGDGLTLRSACQLVMNLGELISTSNQISFNEIEKDVRFIALCNRIQRGNFTQSPYSLILVMRSLQKLGFSANHSLVQEMSNEVVWIMRRCPCKVLAKTIQLLGADDKLRASSSHLENAEKEFTDELSLLSVAIQTMNRRWVEVTTGSDFITAFGISSYLSNETNEKLEDHAAELAAQFSTMEMVKMVINLAQQKRRPTPLLRGIAFRLCKTDEDIPAKDLIELIFAFSKLSFTDQTLMKKLCHELAPEILSINNPSHISSLVTTLGRLRFSHTELIEALAEWIDKNSDILRPFDYASWLLTTSVLSLQSDQQEKFYEKAKLILHEKDTRNPVEWLNIVHALLILNHASQQLLGSVLKPQFVQSIDKLTQDFIGPRMKLLNVNAALKSILESTKSELKMSKAELLGDQYINKWILLESSQDASLSKIVLSSLDQFLPKKYLLQQVKTNTGVFIDAVCVLNSKLEPVPVPNQSFLSETSNQKVAVVVAGYSSLCLGSNKPTGQVCLQERLLTAEGYRVVLVPFNEFNPKATLIQRIHYLESKIKGSSEVPTRVEARRR